jgi:hypothetical protein
MPDARTHGPFGVARLAEALTWAALAVLAFTSLSIAQVAADAGTRLLDARLVAYLLVVAAVLTLWAGTPLALAHLLASGISRRSGSELRAQAGIAAIASLLAIVPAVSHAEFLTSGTAISRSDLVGLVRVVIVLGIVIGVPVAWLWHALGTRCAAAASLRRDLPRIGPALHGSAGRALWWVAGAAFMWTGVRLVGGELRAYASFAGFLVPWLWLAAATMAARLLAGRPRVARGIATAVGVLVAIATSSALADRTLLVEGRTRLLGIAPLVGLADLGRTARPHEAIRFDLQLAAGSECPSVHADDDFASSPVPGRSVILVSVDTLRQDARDSSASPNLEAFAAGGLDFTRAVTTYPATSFALGSAFTGRSPREMMLAPRPYDALFRRTAGRFDVQLAILPGHDAFRLPWLSSLVLQGAPVAWHRDARTQIDALIALLADARAQDDTVLAWVHLLEPHAPYERHGGLAPDASDEAAYASEVAHVDAELGRLFAHLADNEWYDRALVIVFSDHGEALGERGYQGHHVGLDRWLTDIPLVLRSPGVAPAVRGDLVDTTDIAATVLEVAGLRPASGVSGRSLLGAVRGPEEASVAEAFPLRGQDLFAIAAEPISGLDALLRRAERLDARAASYEPKVAVTTSRWRFVVHRVSGLMELYDRDADPGQADNLVFTRPDVVEELSARLRAWHDEIALAIVCAVQPR